VAFESVQYSMTHPGWSTRFILEVQQVICRHLPPASSWAWRPGSIAALAGGITLLLSTMAARGALSLLCLLLFLAGRLPLLI